MTCFLGHLGSLNQAMLTIPTNPRLKVLSFNNRGYYGRVYNDCNQSFTSQPFLRTTFAQVDIWMVHMDNLVRFLGRVMSKTFAKKVHIILAINLYKREQRKKSKKCAYIFSLI
ncbi:hypothetical protein ACJX0J_014739 [Zea mays]